jgi:hypothetical protein
VFIDQQVEGDSVFPGEAARFIVVVLGDAPERPAGGLPCLGKNLLDVGKRELARQTVCLLEDER